MPSFDNASVSMLPTGAVTAPLCERALDEWIAEVQTPLTALKGITGRWCCADFLGHVERLAGALPEAQFAINLCENRYLFTVAFCAAILRGQTNLLPQNRAAGTQQGLLAEYPQTYILHDGGVDHLVTDADHLNVNALNLIGPAATEIPQIRLDQLAALAFTSGSTGRPKANRKTWRTFVVSSRINAAHMLAGQQTLCFQLATVPAQHMWGLETSVLLPLFAPVCATDSKPLFPLDVCKALMNLPEPRLLVSTPVHLRALVQSGLEWPTVWRVLCATAPLPASLAQKVEADLQAELVEVFGCSEVGSMACRFTAREDDWQLFTGLEFVAGETPADSWRAQADHLPDVVILQDLIEFSAARRFRLLGRNEDMLEIAGKRGSLQEMNNLLLTTPGVVDGVVFLPELTGQVNASGSAIRPVALAVVNSDEVTRTTLLARFAEFLDPVFVPRPLYLVDALPREENGKLRRVRLLEFWQQVKASRNN